MKTNPKDMPAEAIALSKAWLDFADYPEEFGVRRQRFREIAKAAALRPELDEKSRFHPVNIQTDKLQCELLSQIRDGTFDVWGRDGGKGLNSPHVSLPNSYFDECREFFKADWENDTIEIHSQKFFDVRIAPANNSSEQADERSKKMGRPSAKGIETAIVALDKRNIGFRNMARKTQCDLVRDEIFGPKVNHDDPPKNYGDGAIKNRLRAYFGVIKS